jgi:hypothetical protein
MSEWILLLLWPLFGWVCGVFVWTDRFVASDLPAMLLFCGPAGPVVSLVRPFCRLIDRSLLQRKPSIPSKLEPRARVPRDPEEAEQARRASQWPLNPEQAREADPITAPPTILRPVRQFTAHRGSLELDMRT